VLLFYVLNLHSEQGDFTVCVLQANWLWQSEWIPILWWKIRADTRHHASF